MVSFWPFRGDETSAASFEKSLSQLSQKISKASSQNDSFRQKQRRYKVLWTLYTSFAYILIALILTLVTGWQTWGAAEYSTLAGAPLVIYGVRTALDAYFNYRISNSQNSLNALNKQRDATIEKLKTATKYNSTQQLLDKYGGTPQRRQPSPQSKNKKRPDSARSSTQNTPQARTGFAPPPTANIPGRSPPSAPVTPQGAPVASPPQPQLDPPGPSEEFAPNAFIAPRPAPVIQPSTTEYAAGGHQWYDRILDVVLGEDETQAKNRIVLICRNCRLVNGQAPPGIRSLEEIGRWRCSSCQAWNGVESEEKKILSEMSSAPITPDVVLNADTDTPEDVSDYEEVDDEFADEGMEEEAEGGAVDTPPASSTRSKARQRKKA